MGSIRMKYLSHVPVEQYGFISVETDTQEEAVVEYKALQRLYTGGSGVGMKKLAEVITEYCQTGSIVEGHEYDFSTNEALLIGEIKKLIRKTK